MEGMCIRMYMMILTFNLPFPNRPHGPFELSFCIRLELDLQFKNRKYCKWRENT